MDRRSKLLHIFTVDLLKKLADVHFFVTLALVAASTIASASINCLSIYPIGLSERFAEMQRRAKILGPGGHPDWVRFKSTTVGARVYVEPDVARDLLGKRPMPSNLPDPVELTILKMDGDHEWWENTLTLELQGLDPFQVKVSQLAFKAFSRPDFGTRGPHVEGDNVRISIENIPSIGSINQQLTVSAFPVERWIVLKPQVGKMSHYYGTFVQALSLQRSVVDIFSGNHRERVVVQSNQIKFLPTRSLDQFLYRLEPLLSIDLMIRPGESIRYRDFYGRIQEGKLVAFERKNEQKFAMISSMSGERVRVRENEVFLASSWNEGICKTPEFRLPSGQNQIPLIVIGDATRAFLNAGAKMTSFSEFVRMPRAEQVRTVVKFVKAHLEWDRMAIEAEAVGIRDYDKMLCTGVGVCRHLSPLVGAVLSEAGFKVRVAYLSKSKEEGHAWIELTDGTGKNIIFVVDPSVGGRNEIYVKTWPEVVAEAAKDKESTAARYYTQAERSFVQD